MNEFKHEYMNGLVGEGSFEGEAKLTPPVYAPGRLVLSSCSEWSPRDSISGLNALASRIKPGYGRTTPVFF